MNYIRHFKETRQEAEAYIFSNSTEWVFNFINVCEALDIDQQAAA